MSKKIISFSLFILVSINAQLSSSSEREILRVLKKDNSTIIELCQGGQCHTLTPPKQLEIDIDNGYEKITIDSLSSGGSILVATLATEGAVNICSKIYQADKTKTTLMEIVPNTEICNYSMRNNILISKYKDAASWTEDIYELSNGNAILKIRDECIDCDQVLRTKFEGSTSIWLIVSNNPDFTLRAPLSSTVKTKKAALYSKPRSSAKTKMYLIQGDKVNLLDYTNAECCWYLIRYETPKRNIDKWMKCSDLDLHPN